MFVILYEILLHWICVLVVLNLFSIFFSSFLCVFNLKGESLMSTEKELI